ncbi:MAG TPA: hypothetical protein VFV07_08200, partial [Rhizomicrobium sp.]|nr:hypothetical protein [Rhizomicrobium sp.]
MRKNLSCALAGIVIVCAGSAYAKSAPPTYYHCGDIPVPSDSPVVKPIFRGHAGLNNTNFDCMAWQDFFYLN